jgi:hypothetical protein
MPTEPAADKVRAYVAGGGRFLALGESVFTAAGRAAAEAILGVEYRGLSPYSVHYFRVPPGDLARRLPCSDWTTYGRAAHLRPTTAQALAGLVYPFTEAKPHRTVSHKHGHPGPLSPLPAATVNAFGQGVAAAVVSPLGALYHEHSYPPLRIFLRNVLDHIVPADMRVADLKAPLSAELRLTRQGNTTIVHLLNFHLNRGSNTVKVIEEIPPVLDAELRLLQRADPRSVCLVPEGRQLRWRREGPHIVVAIPRYDVHAMVAIE